jgi:hypothetical protein
MADEGISGCSATLKFTNGTSTTTIVQITKIGHGGTGCADIDISTMDSPSKCKTFVAGMEDSGQINFETNFEDANETALLAIKRVSGTWTIQVNDSTATGGTSGSKWSWTGYLKPFDMDIPMDDKVTKTCSIKLSGPVSYTAKS